MLFNFVIYFHKTFITYVHIKQRFVSTVVIIVITCLLTGLKFLLYTNRKALGRSGPPMFLRCKITVLTAAPDSLHVFIKAFNCVFSQTPELYVRFL